MQAIAGYQLLDLWCIVLVGCSGQGVVNSEGKQVVNEERKKV